MTASTTRSVSADRRQRLGLLTEPLGYVDGQNLYEYVKSDPVGNSDCAGLATLGWVGGAVKTVVVGEGKTSNLGVWGMLAVERDKNDPAGGILSRTHVDYDIQRQGGAAVRGTKEWMFWDDDRMFEGMFHGRQLLQGDRLVHSVATFDFWTDEFFRIELPKAAAKGSLGCTKGTVLFTWSAQLGLQARPEGNWGKGPRWPDGKEDRTPGINGWDATKKPFIAPDALKFDYKPTLEMTLEFKWNYFEGEPEFAEMRVRSSHPIEAMPNRLDKTAFKGETLWKPAEGQWKAGEWMKLAPPGAP